MSREKQIYIDEAVEEMATAIRPIMVKCSKCEYYNDGSCHKPFDMGCDINEDILNECDAFYEKCYRKASDVAREIFEEIENALDLLRKGIAEGRKNDGIKYQQLHDGRILSLEGIGYFTAELKKKYIG